MAIKKVILYAVLSNLILFFLGPYTLSQGSKKNIQQQKKEEIPKPAYEVEVIVTNVDVVVTDKAGKRITGLKPENFEIYEDGLLQKLTNFYEVKGMEVYLSAPDKEKKKLLVPAAPLPKKSPHREDNKYHSIKVKLAGIKEKYKVRVRQGYLRISQEEKVKESVFSRLHLKRQYNPMNVMVQIMPVEPMPGSNKLRLTLKVLVPLKNLTLYPRKDDYIGQIKVYIALMDSEGRISPCHELTQEIKIPVEDYKIAVNRSYPYSAEMFVDSGHYIISLAVKDVPGFVINYLQLEEMIE